MIKNKYFLIGVIIIIAILVITFIPISVTTPDEEKVFAIYGYVARHPSPGGEPVYRVHLNQDGYDFLDKPGFEINIFDYLKYAIQSPYVIKGRIDGIYQAETKIDNLEGTFGQNPLPGTRDYELIFEDLTKSYLRNQNSIEINVQFYYKEILMDQGTTSWSVVVQ